MNNLLKSAVWIEGGRVGCCCLEHAVRAPEVKAKNLYRHLCPLTQRVGRVGLTKNVQLLSLLDCSINLNMNSVGTH